jgi:hypothetical protein
MSNYDTLKKIIPPDQALANQALSRSLRQVKDIFNTDLPTLSAAVSQLESNKDLNLINDLTTLVPPGVQNFIGNSIATGTGPGNTITINDMIGIAAGNTVTTSLPSTTTALQELDSAGVLNPLTANSGSSTGVNNGIYTVMSYCLSGAFTTEVANIYTVDIPLNTNIPGTPVSYSSANTPSPAIDAAFSTTLIPNANIVIANIATNSPAQSAISNDAYNAMATQLLYNQNNCILAGIEIGNIVNDPANANLQSNSVTTSLGLASQLHDIGLDVAEGGAAQFFEQVANITNLSGQAVIASMREGRNIAVLNAVGIQLDTQLVDVNANTTVANNLGDGQYTVAQAQANIII